VHNIEYEDLDVREQVGGGGYSLVFRGFWKGCPVAIKRWFDPKLTEAQIQEFREEVMILNELKHPNIALMIGACQKLPNLSIVMEYLPKCLHEILHESTIEVDRKRVINLCLDMCYAFNYLHSRKPVVIHRDIKPANFLVDRAWKVKLCDFGLASGRKSGAGTPAYMAPELLRQGAYNESVDVYAFGVMLNEMLARMVPFDGCSPFDIKEKVLAGERPPIPLSCNKPLKALIEACWSERAADRPTFESVTSTLKDMLGEAE